MAQNAAVKLWESPRLIFKGEMLRAKGCSRLFQVPVLWPVIVYFAADHEALNFLCRSIKKSEQKKHHQAMMTWLFRDEHGGAHICVSIDKPQFDDRMHRVIITSLAHEAMHVWQFICEEIGENEPRKALELEAYSFELIFKGLLDAYYECFPTKYIEEKSKRARA